MQWDDMVVTESLLICPALKLDLVASDLMFW